jgi:hypothetical protein
VVSLLVLLLISSIMLVLIARTLVRWGERSGEPARVVHDPAAERWLSTEEVATLLETGTDEVLLLVERDAIPFFLVAGVHRSDPAAYRFSREEIDDWVIG